MLHGLWHLENIFHLRKIHTMTKSLSCIKMVLKYTPEFFSFEDLVGKITFGAF